MDEFEPAEASARSYDQSSVVPEMGCCEPLVGTCAIWRRRRAN